MDVSATQVARECQMGGVEWITLGTRILRTASLAAAIHLQEQVGLRPNRLAGGDVQPRQTPQPLSPD